MYSIAVRVCSLFFWNVLPSLSQDPQSYPYSQDHNWAPSFIIYPYIRSIFLHTNVCLSPVAEIGNFLPNGLQRKKSSANICTYFYQRNKTKAYLHKQKFSLHLPSFFTNRPLYLSYSFFIFVLSKECKKKYVLFCTEFFQWKCIHIF